MTINSVDIQKPRTLLTAVLVCAVVIFIVFTLIMVFRVPDDRSTAVTISPSQVDSITAPIIRYHYGLYLKNEATRQREMGAIITRLNELNNEYDKFNNEQPQRDEKYNHALTASDAELYSFFADRYR